MSRIVLERSAGQKRRSTSVVTARRSSLRVCGRKLWPPIPYRQIRCFPIGQKSRKSADKPRRDLFEETDRGEPGGTAPWDAARLPRGTGGDGKQRGAGVPAGGRAVAAWPVEPAAATGGPGHVRAVAGKRRAGGCRNTAMGGAKRGVLPAQDGRIQGNHDHHGAHGGSRGRP